MELFLMPSFRRDSACPLRCMEIAKLLHEAFQLLSLVSNLGCVMHPLFLHQHVYASHVATQQMPSVSMPWRSCQCLRSSRAFAGINSFKKSHEIFAEARSLTKDLQSGDDGCLSAAAYPMHKTAAYLALGLGH